MDDFFGGLMMINQPNQTKPNQTQTKPTWHTKPNQPTFHWSFPPTEFHSRSIQGLRSAAHGCLEEFGEMDVVEFASAEVGRGCGCCGCGFPWFEGGWLDGFVYKALTVGHGIT